MILSYLITAKLCALSGADFLVDVNMNVEDCYCPSSHVLRNHSGLGIADIDIDLLIYICFHGILIKTSRSRSSLYPSGFFLRIDLH